jgi:HEAT repeat protein
MKRHIHIAIGCIALSVGLIVALYYAEIFSFQGARQQTDALYEGQSAQYWIGQLKSDDPVYRVYAVYALRMIGGNDEAVVPALLEAATDRNADVRLTAIAALGKIGQQPEAVVPVVLPATRDPSRPIRIQAVGVLAKVESNDERIVPALALALKDRDAAVREFALVALAKRGPDAKRALDAIRSARKDPWEKIRKKADELLRTLEAGDPTIKSR